MFLDGKIIPKGVEILVYSHGIHMNPEYYPNPEKFDPSRFEKMDGKHPFAFIPFSAGPRNCIGISDGLILISLSITF
jgi:cytochrome P450